MNLKLPEKPVYRILLAFICFFLFHILLNKLFFDLVFPDETPKTIGRSLFDALGFAITFTVLDYIMYRVVKKIKDAREKAEPR